MLLSPSSDPALRSHSSVGGRLKQDEKENVLGRNDAVPAWKVVMCSSSFRGSLHNILAAASGPDSHGDRSGNEVADENDEDDSDLDDDMPMAYGDESSSSPQAPPPPVRKTQRSHSLSPALHGFQAVMAAQLALKKLLNDRQRLQKLPSYITKKVDGMSSRDPADPTLHTGALLRVAGWYGKQKTRLRRRRIEKVKNALEAIIASGEVVTDIDESSAADDLTKQGDLSFYTPEMLASRDRAYDHPRIREAINEWWYSYGKQMISPANVRNPMEVEISQQEYVQRLALPLYGILLPGKKKSELLQLAYQDWEADTNGKGIMDHRSFYDSMFETADIWVDSVRVEEYVDFLDTCFQKVFNKSRIDCRKERLLREEEEKRSRQKERGLAMNSTSEGDAAEHSVAGPGSSVVDTRSASEFPTLHDFQTKAGATSAMHAASPLTMIPTAETSKSRTTSQTKARSITPSQQKSTSSKVSTTRAEYQNLPLVRKPKQPQQKQGDLMLATTAECVSAPRVDVVFEAPQAPEPFTLPHHVQQAAGKRLQNLSYHRSLVQKFRDQLFRTRSAMDTSSGETKRSQHAGSGVSEQLLVDIAEDFTHFLVTREENSVQQKSKTRATSSSEGERQPRHATARPRTSNAQQQKEEPRITHHSAKEKKGEVHTVSVEEAISKRDVALHWPLGMKPMEYHGEHIASTLSNAGEHSSNKLLGQPLSALDSNTAANYQVRHLFQQLLSDAVRGYRNPQLHSGSASEFVVASAGNQGRVEHRSPPPRDVDDDAQARKELQSLRNLGARPDIHDKDDDDPLAILEQRGSRPHSRRSTVPSKRQTGTGLSRSRPVSRTIVQDASGLFVSNVSGSNSKGQSDLTHDQPRPLSRHVGSHSPSPQRADNEAPFSTSQEHGLVQPMFNNETATSKRTRTVNSQPAATSNIASPSEPSHTDDSGAWIYNTGQDDVVSSVNAAEAEPFAIIEEYLRWIHRRQRIEFTRRKEIKTLPRYEKSRANVLPGYGKPSSIGSVELLLTDNTSSDLKMYK